MTFTQLRTLVAVVDTGSIRGAAGALGVSPPAVSGALSALQRELGITLLERSGRGLRVTPAGRVYTDYARRMLQLREDATAAATETLDPRKGRVRLAAVTTAGEHVLPRFLASFRAEHPETEMSLEVGNRERVWEALDQREADLAIGGRPPVGGRFRSVATRPNVLVLVAAGCGRPVVRAVDVTDVAGRILLQREPGSGTRGTAEELFDDLGIVPATLTLGSNGAIRESVQVGLGITVISRDAVARELEDGSLEEWRLPSLPQRRAWHVVARSGEELAPTAALFLDHLTCPERGPDGFTLVSRVGEN